MSQLSKLRIDLLSLSHEEMMVRIREIREDRKITKSGIPKSVEKKAKRKNALSGLLDALSPEEREVLIAQLEQDENNAA